MAERVWNPQGGQTFESFRTRMIATDRVLDKLVHGVSIEHGPLDANDPNGFDVPTFARPFDVTLAARNRGVIRFTLDGKPPTGEAVAFEVPIRISQTTTLRTALFDGHGQRIGYESAKTFYFVPPHKPNLATGKKVTSSGGTQGPQTPQLAVDDNLDLASSWWATPAPQWMQIDLGSVAHVDRIEVFPFWDGSRYYQYTVSISVDGSHWTTVADRSQNTVPASASGDDIRFPATNIRFVKINMLRGSANEAVHLVEVRVWPAVK
jgi:hypothetical protein